MWLSSVLHMGEWGPCGVGAGFCWNDGLIRRASCAAVGLPCAVRGVCAHGSGIVVVADGAVPHDSAVSSGAECARVCNIGRPGTCGYQQSRPAAVQPGSYALQPRDHPTRDTHRHPSRSRCTDAPQSRRGLRPISAQVSTDLDADYDRSRRHSAAQGVPQLCTMISSSKSASQWLAVSEGVKQRSSDALWLRTYRQGAVSARLA